MTREEAIEQFQDAKCSYYKEYLSSEALDMAIKALEQEPCCNCIEFKRYAKEIGFEIEQESILDKIRAEIAEYGSIMVAYAITKDTKTDKGIEKLVSDVLKEAKEQVLEIIDKYKAESEEKE